MVEDIQTQVVENLNKCTYFSLQMYEFTNISNSAQFIAFVKYDTNNGIKEDLLCCSPLETNTTGKCVIDTFIKRTSKYDIDWGKCIARCTHSAKAMTGHRSSLIVKSQEIVPNATWRHCVYIDKLLPPKLYHLNWTVL